MGEQQDEDGVGLFEKVDLLIPAYRERLSKIKREHGNTELQPHTIQNLIAGSRGIKSLLWDVSKLEPDRGILYRGLSIPQCFSVLPSSSGEEPPVEGVLWLLLTGCVPTPAQMKDLSVDLADRVCRVPDFVFDCINALPVSAHPMTQLVCGIMALQTDSQFARAYASSTPTQQLWRQALEDSLNIIAKVPRIAGFIYRRIYHEGDFIGPSPNLDLAANFCHMLGFDDPHMYDMMRKYLVIHSDHEGGAVSAHAVRLVGSALADPYLAFAAGMNGCAGPLHGLAIQDSFKWIKQVSVDLGGSDVEISVLEDYVRSKLQAGHIIPGFGHALLKQTDPRYTCLYEFCEKNFPDDPYFQLVKKLKEVVPAVMRHQGKENRIQISHKY
ncbi:hypothetical protein KP509_21G025400 [Ceratopteris richardii]|uniref:Citrate synthase n=1 Tax=Ceratopteris richardii TaxID=49495 RepID=A0A8T2S8H7_CERRI|nr:hypothetical protein KP509_21G025400 [Ceratopteris richardii]